MNRKMYVKMFMIENELDSPDCDFEARDITLVGYERKDAIVQICSQNLNKKYSYLNSHWPFEKSA